MSKSPYVQARIAQAKHKKDQEIQQAALMSFRRGVIGAAECAAALVNDPLTKIYSLQSLIMWKMKILAGKDRMLLGADSKLSLDELIEKARAALRESPSEEDFIAVSMTHARSENEAWKLHFQLTGIRQVDLPAERKAKMETTLAPRFPTGTET